MDNTILLMLCEQLNIAHSHAQDFFEIYEGLEENRVGHRGLGNQKLLPRLVSFTVNQSTCKMHTVLACARGKLDKTQIFSTSQVFEALQSIE
jgi:hypothetical protein